MKFTRLIHVSARARVYSALHQPLLLGAILMVGNGGVSAATFADCRQYGGSKTCTVPEKTPWRVGWGNLYYDGIAVGPQYCRTLTTNHIAKTTPNAAVDANIQMFTPEVIADCKLDVSSSVRYNDCDSEPESVVPFDTTIANRPESPYSGKTVIAIASCDARQWLKTNTSLYQRMPFPWRDACSKGTPVASPSGKVLCLMTGTEDEEQEEPDEDCEGNPVDLSTGNKFAAAFDYRDANGDLTFRRQYNSGLNGVGILGRAWSSEYDARISHFRDSSGGSTATEWISVRRGSGATVQMQPAGQGAFAPLSKYVTLRLTVLRDAQGVPTGYLVNDGKIIETFSADGRLTSIVRKDGYTRTLAYDADDRLSSVTDTFGRKLEFGYLDTQFQKAAYISSMKVPSGGVYYYSYNQIGPFARIDNVQKPDSKRIVYLYDASYRLIGIKDELGVRTSTYGYDESGAAVSTTRAGGAREVVTTRQVNADGSLTVAANVAGVATTREYTNVAGRMKLTAQNNPAGAGCSASTQRQSFDPFGNVTQLDRFGGGRICQSYDTARRLPIATIDGLDQSYDCNLAVGSTLPPDGRVTRREWHPDFDLPVRVASPKNITSFIFNGQPDPTNGNQVSACVAGGASLPDGKPIAVLCKVIEQATLDENGSQGFAATPDPATPARSISYSYNQRGQLLTQTDGRGGVVTLAYHAAGANATVGDLQRITPPKGLWTAFNSYNLDGHATELVDANGLITKYAYDSLNRTREVTVAGRTTLLGYDDKGRLTTVTGYAGEQMTLSYDGADRLTGVRDRAGNSITYYLDAAGHAIRTEYKDPSGAIKRWMEASFDALNRLVRLKGVLLPRP